MLDKDETIALLQELNLGKGEHYREQNGEQVRDCYDFVAGGCTAYLTKMNGVGPARYEMSIYLGMDIGRVESEDGEDVHTMLEEIAVRARER